jgi:cytochrome c biogenesis protein CcmG, thiol:disulfide interchange protein DsbE
VLLGLAVAVAATIVLLQLRASLAPGDDGRVARGKPAPAIVGTTLDDASFDLASLRGRPVVVNFWDAACEPCREEFPLLEGRLAAHADDGLAIVGVLFVNAPGPARDFVAQYGATWPTVQDPSGAIRSAYRVPARPQSYLIDRQGIVRWIQVGQFANDCEFEREYALIGGATGETPPPTPVPCGDLVGGGDVGGEPSPSIELPQQQ